MGLFLEEMAVGVEERDVCFPMFSMCHGVLFSNFRPKTVTIPGILLVSTGMWMREVKYERSAETVSFFSKRSGSFEKLTPISLIGTEPAFEN